MDGFQKIRDLQGKLVDAVNGSGLPLTTVYYVLETVQNMVRQTVEHAGKEGDNADPDTDNKG